MSHGRASCSQNDVRLEGNQFRRIFANSVSISRRPAYVDPHVVALGPAQFVHPLQERSVSGLADRVISSRGVERADAPHLTGLLLRIRGERPSCYCATEKRDELAPPHCRP